MLICIKVLLRFISSRRGGSWRWNACAHSGRQRLAAIATALSLAQARHECIRTSELGLRFFDMEVFWKVVYGASNSAGAMSACNDSLTELLKNHKTAPRRLQATNLATCTPQTRHPILICQSLQWGRQFAKL
jgi:hypothetical protein